MQEATEREVGADSRTGQGGTDGVGVLPWGMSKKPAIWKRVGAGFARVERSVTRAVLISDLWERAEPTAKRGIRFLLGGGVLGVVREWLGSMEAFPSIMLQVVYWTGTLLLVAGVLWFVSANATPRAMLRATPQPRRSVSPESTASQSPLQAMIPYSEMVAKFQALESRATAAFQYIAERDRYAPADRIARDAEVFALMQELKAMGVGMRFEADPGSSLLIAFMKNRQLVEARQVFPLETDTDE